MNHNEDIIVTLTNTLEKKRFGQEIKKQIYFVKT